jgi:hypothetical protein
MVNVLSCFDSFDGPKHESKNAIFAKRNSKAESQNGDSQSQKESFSILRYFGVSELAIGG